MIAETIPESMLPDGVWHKTYVKPKPVGVPLFIKKGGIVSVDIHSGTAYFVSSEGKTIENTVYSYDRDEEWFEQCKPRYSEPKNCYVLTECDVVTLYIDGKKEKFLVHAYPFPTPALLKNLNGNNGPHYVFG